MVPCCPRNAEEVTGMSWEYADLFDAEAEPEDAIEQVTFWQDEPSNLHAGQMGYRRRTTKAGPRLEAEIYPVFGREERGQLRTAKKNMTPEKQRRMNERRAKHQLILLIETNFTENDYHLTLTYAGNPPDLDRCKRDVRNFLDRVKRLRIRRGLDELKYIYAIGHDSGARIHVHMIINGGIRREELERIWAKGRTNAVRLQPDERGLQGIANYLFRQNTGKKKGGQLPGKKTWVPSKNLKRPKTRKRDCKCSNARVRRIAGDIQSEAKEVMEQLYPGYTFVECRVRYSDIVDGVYICCVMRKWEDAV